MKRKFPKTYSYFKRFESELRNRSGYKQYFEPSDPFWTMYNVGTYTLEPWKVLWPEVAHTVRAGVAGPSAKGTLTAIPDHTLIAVSCKGSDEAFYISALLNSSPAQAAASGYIVLHPSPHILEHIAIPKFAAESDAHATLAELARKCHNAQAINDMRTLEIVEAEIDKAAARLWNISDHELIAIQNSLRESEDESQEAVSADGGS